MSLTCSTCGSDEVMAVKPGSYEEASATVPEIITKRHVPDQAFCWKHWPCRAQQPDLFEAAP